jgi:peptide/nickel transport system permease protein
VETAVNQRQFRSPPGSESLWQLAWRKLRRHRLAMVSLVVIFLLILMAIFAPFVATHDPTAQPRGAGLRAMYFQPPSAEHWLGTDDLGRDVFSRLIYGSRVSLLVGFLAAFSSVLLGTIMGAIAGYFSGRPLRFYVGPFAKEPGGWRLPFALWRVASWVLLYGALYFAGTIAWTLAQRPVQAGLAGEWSTNAILSAIGLGLAYAAIAFVAWRGAMSRFQLDLDVVISRLIDFMLTLPSLPILLVLSAILRDPRAAIGNWMYATFGTASSVVIIVLILVLFGWITTARLVRGAFLSLRESEFTMAAQALGTGSGGIMFKHLVPNAMAPIIVEGTLQVGIAILVEAALSFLGFGIQPPVSTWGNMLTNAQTYIFYAPWLAFPPGVMIVITVLAINFLGDGLRDALDPHRQH